MLSHGYVNSKYLLSIAPITADKIVVWTRMQKNEIRNVLNEFQASKVKYLGWPKHYKYYNSWRIKENQKPLFVASCMCAGERGPKHFILFEEAINNLISCHEKVAVRLHPKDRKYLVSPVLERAIAEKNYFEL